MPLTRGKGRTNKSKRTSNPSGDELLQSGNEGSDKRRLMDSSDSSTSDSGSDFSSEKEKRNKKKRKNKNKETPAKFGKRVHSPEDVVHRHRVVLKEFWRTRSISLSCESLSVDKNTITLTAIIAEVLIVAEGEDFRHPPEFTEEDTVGNYAKTCKTFLEGNKPLEEKIKQLKTSLSCYP
ncbi:hypothetical protein JZ751_023817 [Albula glossodonta]|uniref:Uncharacterized protein n=1 Tax=Albula glossodonta TaxID=121402 RepID=A0A8T2NK96_9TELE|nr:hypothetical protein JZ751_023817 [Albula glossodonta]